MMLIDDEYDGCDCADEVYVWVASIYAFVY